MPESFFNKVAGCMNFFKKETLARCFLVNFTKFLRTPSLKNTSFISPLHVWRRLPYIIKDDSGEGLRGLQNSLTNE